MLFFIDDLLLEMRDLIYYLVKKGYQFLNKQNILNLIKLLEAIWMRLFMQMTKGKMEVANALKKGSVN